MTIQTNFAVPTSMSLIADATAFEKRLAGLPVTRYRAGENVLAFGSATGKLMILKSGAVEVVKQEVQLAKVSTPGAVFGELAPLMGQPHTADLRALEQSEFYVADAEMLSIGDPIVALYVAGILARRLDNANQALIEVKRELQAGEPRRLISKTVERVEELLTSSDGVSLVYAGYPYDPFALTNKMH